MKLTNDLDKIIERDPIRHLVGHSKLPWDEPGFSRRMLHEHLNQDHDHASRRLTTIDTHVEWIFRHLLEGLPGKVLDLGCGPGLYCERLAKLGCPVVGIDFSPASIRHAREQAEIQDLSCTYLLSDLTVADLGTDHDLAMLLFGELNTFSRSEASGLLRRVKESLKPGGTVLLEVHTRDSVEAAGRHPAGWYSSRDGLFADTPHVVLFEQAWVAEAQLTSTRYYVFDTGTGQVEEYRESLTAYTLDDYQAVLQAVGFTDVMFHPGMGNSGDPEMLVLTARRG